MQDFFHILYRYSPNPELQLVAWGSVGNPLFLSVKEVLANSGGGLPQDKDVFFTPAVFTKPRRIKKNVAGASVLWVDRDVYKNGNSQYTSLLPPTIVVKSGRGEHLYWALDKFYSPQMVEQANKAIHSHLGVRSEGTWDSTRFLRVPGTINCKYLDQKHYPEYTEPIPCEIVSIDDNNIYPLSDLLNLKNVGVDFLSTPVKDNGDIDRSLRDYKLVSQLRSWGITEKSVKISLYSHSTKARSRSDYLQRTLNAGLDTKPLENTPYLNAKLTPIARLFNTKGEETSIAFTVTWGKREILISGKASDFLTARAITLWLESNGAGNRNFVGTDKNAKFLWRQLDKLCPDEEYLEVRHAGRYDLEDGVSVYVYGRRPNEIIIHPAEKNIRAFWKPLIDLKISLELEPEPPDKNQIENLLNAVQGCQVPEVMQLCLGWIAITPFRVLLKKLHYKIPHLLLFGFAGSGKTSLIQSVLLPLLGLFTEYTASDTTNFSLIGTMSLSNAWPSWFGEYRTSNNNALDFHSLLRQNYDNAFEPRGTPQQKIIQHKLVSPVVVDGENSFPDGANAGRAIMLRLFDRDIVPDSTCYKNFKKIENIDKDLFKKFAYQYIAWTLSKDVSYIKDKINRSDFSFLGQARGAANYSVVWAGLSILKDFISDMSWNVDILQSENAFTDAINFTFIKGIGIRTDIDNLVEQISQFHLHKDIDVVWDGEFLWFNLVKVIKVLNVDFTTGALKIQLEQRLGTYIVGPKDLGGATMWGIDIKKARAMGLDVKEPQAFEKINLKLQNGGVVN